MSNVSSRRCRMPRRTPYMPGQSMYAGAWDVLMLTLDVGCSTGLALKPPGGPSAVAAVAIVAVPAARPCVQARRVVGVNAAADVINRKRPRIVRRSGVPHGLGRLCLPWSRCFRAWPQGYALYAVHSDAATSQNPGWVASRRGLAPQSKACLWLGSESSVLDRTQRLAAARLPHQNSQGRWLSTLDQNLERFGSIGAAAVNGSPQSKHLQNAARSAHWSLQS